MFNLMFAFVDYIVLIIIVYFLYLFGGRSWLKKLKNSSETSNSSKMSRVFHDKLISESIFSVQSTVSPDDGVTSVIATSLEVYSRFETDSDIFFVYNNNNTIRFHLIALVKFAT